MTNLKLNVRPFEGTFSNLVDNLFTDLPTLLKNEMTMRDGKGFAPVNIKETKDAYVLEIVAPGKIRSTITYHYC
jgi:HSP20 family molecular chaperone IbpA